MFSLVFVSFSAALTAPTNKNASATTVNIIQIFLPHIFFHIVYTLIVLKELKIKNFFLSKRF